MLLRQSHYYDDDDKVLKDYILTNIGFLKCSFEGIVILYLFPAYLKRNWQV